MKEIARTINFLKHFNRKKVLFIWMPKTAGTSLYIALKESSKMREYLTIEYAKDFFNNQGLVTFSHISIKSLRESGIISDKFYADSYKFCVCRNPFDRFVSLFHYLKKRKLIEDHLTPFDLMNKIMEGIPPIGAYNVKGLSQCNPQVEWIRDIELDEILRFENLDKDIKSLEKFLNTEIEIPLLNTSPNRKKISDELDLETMELIKEYYKEDFEFFNYSANPDLA